ncbi:MAG: hypothetical protein ACOCV2_09820, partial [Persicimonas sp.]
TLLGEREEMSDELGTYEGYSADHPFVDLAHALLHTLDIDTLDEVLFQLAGFLEREHQHLAGVLFAVDEAAEILGDEDDAELSDDQTLAYDLLPLLEELAEDPELWRDFFWALRQPIARRTGDPMQRLLSYRDENPAVPEADGPYDSCFQTCKQLHPVFDDPDGSSSCLERYRAQQNIDRYECIRDCPDGEIFSNEMNFEATEAPSNRSMFQRLFHLLRDTSEAPYDLQITQPGWASDLPPLIELDGSAEAFIRSVGSELDLADFIDIEALEPLGTDNIAELLSAFSGAFGATLDRHATPDQITRLFNQDELSGTIFGIDIEIEPPVCHDGFEMADHHADMLFASEASGLIDTLAPLACAFSHHDREDLLADIFVVIHDHYSSRDDLYEDAEGDPSPMKGANLVSYEPAIKEMLERGTLFDSLYYLSTAVEDFKSVSEEDFVEQLRLLVYNAARTDDGFEGRDGQTSLELADGRTVDDLSRLHLVMDSAGRLHEQVADDPRAKEAFEDLFGAIYEVFLSTEWDDDGSRFEHEGTGILAANMTRHLARRAEDARDEGRLSQWLTDDKVTGAEDLFESRGLAAGVDLVEQLGANHNQRALTDDLLEHLLGSSEGVDQATMGVYGLAVRAKFEELWPPLAHFMADLIDPDREWDVGPYAGLSLPSHLLQTVHDTVERDDDEVGLETVRRGLSTRSDGTIPLGEVSATIADYLRVDPDSDEPYDADDYRHVFDEFAGWLGDDLHGLERLYELVDMRNE